MKLQTRRLKENSYGGGLYRKTCMRLPIFWNSHCMLIVFFKTQWIKQLKHAVILRFICIYQQGARATTNWTTSRPVLNWPSQQKPEFSIKSWQSIQGELESLRGKGSEERSKNPYCTQGVAQNSSQKISCRN